MKLLDSDTYGDKFKPFCAVLEFKNKQDNTPVLFSAKRNNLEFFEELVELGANLYTNCNRLMNVLHYAVLNENSKMIEIICWSDAEGNRLA